MERHARWSNIGNHCWGHQMQLAECAGCCSVVMTSLRQSSPSLFPPLQYSRTVCNTSSIITAALSSNPPQMTFNHSRKRSMRQMRGRPTMLSHFYSLEPFVSLPISRSKPSAFISSICHRRGFTVPLETIQVKGRGSRENVFGI
jgi:hypothetical protein